MRIAAFIEYCAIVAGILAIVASRYFPTKMGIELGLYLVGVGFLIASLQAIFTMQMSLRFSDHGWDDWSGSPAVIAGLMQLIIGLLFVGSAYAQSTGSWQATLNFVSSHPWPALVSVGLLVLGTGLLIFILADRYGGKLRFIFVGMPQIIVSIVVMALGIATVCAGAWDWANHASLERFANTTAETLGMPQPMPLWRKTVSMLK